MTFPDKSRSKNTDFWVSGRREVTPIDWLLALHWPITWNWSSALSRAIWSSTGCTLKQEPITRWLGILSSMHRCQTPPEKRKRERRIWPGELSSFLRFHNSQAIERPSSFQYWLRAWEGSIDSYWLKSALWAIDMLGKSSLESYSLLIIEGRFLFFSDAIVKY